MTVLVTGGTGFVGAYLARRLVRAGRRVIALDPSPSNVLQVILTPDELSSVTVVTGEAHSLRDLGEAIRAYQVDRIVHLASLLHPASDQHPARAVEVNVQGQVAVLEAARLWDIKKVVWASSVVVFGDRSSHARLPLPNDAAHHPVSVYGATKSLNEFLAQHYRKHWQVDALGLRFTLVYGPGRVRGASTFVNEMMINPALGRPARVPFGDDVVDWQYVEDVARLIERCLDVARTRTATFNTRFDLRSIREAGQYVQRLLPEARIEYVPGTFGIAWELDDSALQDEIGFQPEYPMERGILETINDVRRRHHLPPLEAPAGSTPPRGTGR
ncbi:MAG: NAD(P)-dependent oxidoreductase [Armatimonadota bacterium]|nr:NAD(P)-dependent oxidoreductase [Armatimonadota bacterium]